MGTKEPAQFAGRNAQKRRPKKTLGQIRGDSKSGATVCKQASAKQDPAVGRQSADSITSMFLSESVCERCVCVYVYVC